MREIPQANLFIRQMRGKQRSGIGDHVGDEQCSIGQPFELNADGKAFNE